MFSNAVRVYALGCLIYTAGVSAEDLGAQTQSEEPADTVVLSISDVLKMAAEANPELRAASWRPQASRGDLRTARTLRFNPDALFESRSPGDGRFEAELGLELEMAGQRGLRGRAGEASVSASERRFDDAGRRILTIVSYAHHGLVAAEQRVLVVAEINRLNARFFSAVQTELAEGEVTLLESNLAAIEAARAEARALAAASVRSTAALELARLLGMDPSSPLRTTGAHAGEDLADGPTVATETYVQQALLIRPDLLALEHEVERARQSVRLTRREALPNLRVTGLATQEDPSRDATIGIGVGITLPLFNRNQGRSARRQAELGEAQQLRYARELRIRTEVEDALRIYDSAQREVSILASALLGPIRDNQALLDIAYREGKIDLASVLLLRNQLLDAELSYWDAWQRRERARTGVISATGTILQGISLTSGGN